MSGRFIVLHGSASSLVLELVVSTEPGVSVVPLWRYWGVRLPDGVTPGYAVGDARALPPSSLEQEQALSVVPAFGVGWFNQSALLAHRQDQQFAQTFSVCRVLSHEPGQQLTLQLDDPVAHLSLQWRVSLDEYDVVRIASTLTNTSSQPQDVVDVQWLAAATLPLPASCTAVRSFYGQWASEFQQQTDVLSRSQWRRENRRGRGSHDCFPGAVVLEAGANEDAGMVYGAHLAWSGNHQQSIEWLDDGRYQWQWGEWLAPGEVRLAPGESLQTPELVAACSPRGLNGLAACFHAATRAALRWPGGVMAPRPVHLNTWEAIYFNHDLDALKALADAAAEVGIERFVLDDGWFHGRHSDRAALGDWWPDGAKYPQGLAPLVAYVQERGMSFGLWVEPEMVNPDSELYQLHPDWALQLAGRPLLTARNQLVLDISRPEVADYLFERLDSLLRSVPIAYFKWDMNRDLTTAGRSGHAAYRLQVQALYGLLERLRQAHPALEIESCSSGGARIDLGVLQHTHRVWTSDCNDARSRVAIQRGALQFFPPEILGAHIGPAPAHTTGRSQSLDFRAAVALPCHLGVETDLRRLNVSERARLAAWIALYKQWRDRLHGVPLWQGEAGDGMVWQAHGDTQSLVLLIYRVEPTTQRYSPALRLPMLDAARRYRVRRIDTALNMNLPGGGHSVLHDALTGDGTVLAGAWLASAGLPLPRLIGESALLLEVAAI